MIARTNTLRPLVRSVSRRTPLCPWRAPDLGARQLGSRHYANGAGGGGFNKSPEDNKNQTYIIGALAAVGLGTLWYVYSKVRAAQGRREGCRV